MGLAMFLDDKIGPMRSQKLMSQAPGIILKTDAHVTDELMQRFAPVLRAFGWWSSRPHPRRCVR